MAKATAAKAVEPVEDEAPVAEPTIDPVAEPGGDDAPAVETPAEDEAPAAPDPSRCVVDDGRCVGRAVNGRVCSYHAAYYRADGTLRVPR